MGTIIEVVNLYKSFVNNKDMEIKVLEDINLNVDEQEFVCLLGPSGCGKSTFLRLLAGLEKPTKGEIKLLNKKIESPIPEAGMVFQEYSLMPWKNILDNVAFGLELKGMNKKKRHAIANEILKRFYLDDFKESFPHELSGGMKQRVAIARSIVNSPKILYMDEPFGALDAYTRFKMQEELVDFWINEKRTIIFVTHSVEEAILLGSRVMVMSSRPGKIISDFKIDLPYPRNRWNEEFGKHFNKLMDLMQG